MCILLLSVSGVSAQSGGKFGLLFDLTSLLADIAAFNDGYQGGVGLKWNASENISARALINFSVLKTTTPAPVTSDSTFGFSLGGEYHFSGSKVSPYLGASFGLAMASQTVADVTVNDPTIFYVGALGGAEVKIQESISLFFEYNLMAIFDDGTSMVRMGTDALGPGAGKNVIFGVIVYF